MGVSPGVVPLAQGKEEAKERHSEGAVKVGSFPPEPPSYSNQGFRFLTPAVDVIEVAPKAVVINSALYCAGVAGRKRGRRRMSNGS